MARSMTNLELKPNIDDFRAGGKGIGAITTGEEALPGPVDFDQYRERLTRSELEEWLKLKRRVVRARGISMLTKEARNAKRVLQEMSLGEAAEFFVSRDRPEARD